MKATNLGMEAWFGFLPYQHYVINFLLSVIIFQQFCFIAVDGVVPTFGNVQQQYGEPRYSQSQSQLQQQHLNSYHQSQYPNQNRQPQYNYNDNYPTSQQQQRPQEEMPRQAYYNKNRITPSMQSTSNQYSQQMTNRQNMHSSPLRPNDNKRVIWVPADAIDKYPLARKIQFDDKNQLHEIEVCNPDYRPVGTSSNMTCRPICENCQNGVCIAPGNCTCYEGFVSNDNGDCVFTCPLGCLNGRCYLDGTCQCDTGYKLDETRKFCRPICSNGCGTMERHNCTEPEVCGCAKNYQLTDDRCQPTCNPDCGPNGSCREGNECLCNPGYNLRDGTCQSDCYQKCDNGICYAKNRCICNPNYVYHERSTICIPE